MRIAKIIIGAITLLCCQLVLTLETLIALGYMFMPRKEPDLTFGTLLGLSLLISGIVAIVTYKRRGGTIFCTIAYALTALLCLLSDRPFQYSVVLGIICLMFAVFFLISFIQMKNSSNSSHKALPSTTE